MFITSGVILASVLSCQSTQLYEVKRAPLPVLPLRLRGAPMAHCRVPPTCSKSSAGFVANRLTGARVVNLPGGRAVVPLLHPQQHGLPFLLTLELHAAPPRATATPPAPLAARLDRSLYALHYVLAGSGQLVRPSGDAEELQAGDSVLMHSGAAACCAAEGPAGAVAGGASLPPDSPWQLAELVAYMPRYLFEQRQQQWQQQRLQNGPGRGQEAEQEQEQEAAWARMLQSASLQPLLLQPATDGGPDGCSSEDMAAAAAEAQLPAEFVSVLLAGARDTARRALLQQEQEGQGQGSGDPEATTTGSSRNGGNGSGRGRGKGSIHSALGVLAGALHLPPAVRAVRAAANSVSAWWVDQQQRTCPVTRRTLAELTAFRLPNQTNRLAVQFDPFSQPQVPFISGIEVFERGHRTTPHVHPRAHELFFILAGEGTGFCGEQRFPVAAGDVVVFRPGAVHGIDNGSASRMYCLELMVPNEAFAEMVRAGEDTGRLSGDDLCVLAAIGCR